MNIAVVYDGFADDPAAPADVAGVREAVDAVCASLDALGHHALQVGVNDLGGAWTRSLLEWKADAVFNLCEGVGGESGAESSIARALDELGLPFTGSGWLALDQCRRKDVANRLLDRHGVAVPEWTSVDDTFDPDAWPLFPAIVKPAAEDASIGISAASVAYDGTQLRAAIAAGAAHAPLIVQRYVDGRELNTAIVSDEVLPVAEIRFLAMAPGEPQIVSYAAKWDTGSDDDLRTPPSCPAPLTATMAEMVSTLTRATCAALGIGGYARVDMRLDGEGRVWVIDVNPNPDLAPSAGLMRMAAAHGWNYTRLVERVLDAALAAASDGASSAAPLVAPLEPHHREAVETLVRETGVFREAEVLVALEVLDSFFTHPGQDYTALGAFTREGSLLGYVCYGPTPGAEGTYDLYWIAVSPSAQGRGVGTQLIQEVERRLALQHARLVIIETSGTAAYEATRVFYRARGYDEVARVPDFYADGDDRLILAKRMHPERERHDNG